MSVGLIDQSSSCCCDSESGGRIANRLNLLTETHLPLVWSTRVFSSPEYVCSAFGRAKLRSICALFTCLPVLACTWMSSAALHVIENTFNCWIRVLTGELFFSFALSNGLRARVSTIEVAHSGSRVQPHSRRHTRSCCKPMAYKSVMVPCVCPATTFQSR